MLPTNSWQIIQVKTETVHTWQILFPDLICSCKPNNPLLPLVLGERGQWSVTRLWIYLPYFHSMLQVLPISDNLPAVNSDEQLSKGGTHGVPLLSDPNRYIVQKVKFWSKMEKERKYVPFQGSRMPKSLLWRCPAPPQNPMGSLQCSSRPS